MGPGCIRLASGRIGHTSEFHAFIAIVINDRIVGGHGAVEATVVDFGRNAAVDDCRKARSCRSIK